jgi:hypothetical protein
MDPRMREDDNSNVILDLRMREDDVVVVIPAEPALDMIGGQESIPLDLARTQVLDFALQVMGPSPAVPALGQ